MRRLLACLLALSLWASAAWADSAYPVVSANTTNCQLVVSGTHLLSGMTMGNTGSAAWVKFYDMASIPTAGASQGATPSGNPYVFPVPGNSALAGTNVWPPAIRFTLGIALCITGGAANSDTTAVTTGQVAGTITWR